MTGWDGMRINYFPVGRERSGNKSGNTSGNTSACREAKKSLRGFHHN